MTKISFKSNLPNDAQIQKLFGGVNGLDRFKVYDKTVRAGARPVVTRSRQLVPRGSVTGTSQKRSSKQRKNADWSEPLWKTISLVVRKYAKSGIAVVGPKWPKGNKAYFNTSPSGRQQVLWGKKTGVTIPQIRNWIVQAFDETKTQQLGAMQKKLTELTDKVMRSK